MTRTEKPTASRKRRQNAMAQEAKKPMFLLRPADGAIGGHQGAVRQAYLDFQALAQQLWTHIHDPT